MDIVRPTLERGDSDGKKRQQLQWRWLRTGTVTAAQATRDDGDISDGYHRWRLQLVAAASGGSYTNRDCDK